MKSHKLSIAFLLLLTTATAAVAQEKLRCYAAPDPSLGFPWAWRTVEGKTCWYKGPRKYDKSLLYWPQEARAESAAPAEVISPATVEPPTSAPEPEPEPLQSYSAEDQKLLESYWPDLAALMAERSPTHQEMFSQPPESARWRDHDIIALLVLALVLVSGLVLALETLRTKLDQRRTA